MSLFFLTVIASAAKQSILSLRGAMDCFAALAMTAGAMDCFAEPVIGRAFARPVGSQRRIGSARMHSRGTPVCRLRVDKVSASLPLMDAQPSPSRSISSHLRGALNTCRLAWSHAARLALDIALPTLCVACREPVDGEGVCAACWAKLSFIAPPFC